MEDYRANNDPALRAALSYVPKKSLKEILLETLSANDPPTVVKRFSEWRAEPANAYIDAEPRLISLGYELKARKRVDQAIEIFKLGVSAFPESANAYDSLGEAYQAAGQTELAIKNYEKALELNPKMISSIEALKKLRGK